MRGTIAILVMLQAGVAVADDAVRARGLADFAANDFSRAAGAFAANFALTADPTDLFAWAQAERQTAQCPRAVPLYALFLSTNPPSENRRAATQGASLCAIELPLELTEPGALQSEKGRAVLTELYRQGYALHAHAGFLYALARVGAPSCEEKRPLLERVLKESDVARLQELAEADLARCPAAQPAPPPEPAHWYRDRPTLLLFLGGAVTTAAGGTLLFLGSRKVDNADGATYGAFSDEVDGGRRMQFLGGAALGLGVVAASLGAWRMWNVPVEVAPTPDGVGATMSFHWD